MGTGRPKVNMPTICVFYASEDEVRATALVHILETQYKIVWDKILGAGKFHEQMQPLITTSNAAVVLWSKHSIAPGCVAHSEAIFANDAGVPVLNVRLDDSTVPIPFNNEIRFDLSSWDGISQTSKLEHLFASIRSLIGNSSTRLLLGKRQLNLPCFFASVSSHETQLTPLAALEVAEIIGTPNVLVSAYDLCFQSKNRPDLDEQMMNKISEMRASGSVVLLDSGNYESSRRKCAVDVWSLELFHRVLQEAPYDFAFSYDSPFSEKIEASAESLAAHVVDQVRRDNVRSSGIEIMPIVHIPTDGDTVSNIGLLPEAFRLISLELRPTLIAVPERELGDGLWSKVETVKLIRRSLDTLPWYQPIHLLGTGNPLSLAFLALAGADSFDGLEWLRTCIDRTDGRLYHYQHFSFLEWQHSQSTNTALLKTAIEAPSDVVTFNAKVALHNLDYMAFDWISEVAHSKKVGSLHLLVNHLISEFRSPDFSSRFKEYFVN